jgi:hypothetical protein
VILLSGGHYISIHRQNTIFPSNTSAPSLRAQTALSAVDVRYSKHQLSQQQQQQPEDQYSDNFILKSMTLLISLLESIYLTARVVN